MHIQQAFPFLDLPYEVQERIVKKLNPKQRRMLAVTSISMMALTTSVEIQNINQKKNIAQLFSLLKPSGLKHQCKTAQSLVMPTQFSIKSKKTDKSPQSVSQIVTLTCKTKIKNPAPLIQWACKVGEVRIVDYLLKRKDIDFKAHFRSFFLATSSSDAPKKRKYHAQIRRLLASRVPPHQLGPKAFIEKEMETALLNLKNLFYFRYLLNDPKVHPINTSQLSRKTWNIDISYFRTLIYYAVKYAPETVGNSQLSHALYHGDVASVRLLLQKVPHATRNFLYLDFQDLYQEIVWGDQWNIARAKQLKIDPISVFNAEWRRRVQTEGLIKRVSNKRKIQSLMLIVRQKCLKQFWKDRTLWLNTLSLKEQLFAHITCTIQKIGYKIKVAPSPEQIEVQAEIDEANAYYNDY